MDDDIAISVKNVSKDFKLPHERADSVKSLFVNPFNKNRKKYEVQHALHDISIDIKKGEFFGIVGRNGSGKSTLLKIIAGIYQPNKGSIAVNGRLVPFIELGVGFNPQLTGRENVYLNGAMLGFSEKEVDAKYSAIVDFAELERFMDQKLKNYSSGMQVRLAFSVATILAESDILLIDEVLAVGDADFKRKCYEYFKKLKKENKTVVFVSHDMNAIKEYCDKGILINDSNLELFGSTGEIAERYTKLFNKSIEGLEVDSTADNRWGNKDISIKSAPVITLSDSFMDIKFNIEVKKIDISPIVGISIDNTAGQVVVGTNTEILNISTEKINKKSEINFRIPNIFSSGDYYISIAIHAADGVTVYDWWANCGKFHIENIYNTPYLVSPKCEVSIS